MAMPTNQYSVLTISCMSSSTYADVLMHTILVMSKYLWKVVSTREHSRALQRRTSNRCEVKKTPKIYIGTDSVFRIYI